MPMVDDSVEGEMPYRRALAWWAKEPHDGLQVVPRRLLARIFAIQYVVAGLLALAWVSLPHTTRAGDDVVAGAGTAALVCGLVLWPLARRRRVPPVVLHAAIAASQILIAFAVSATGDPESLLLVFLLWSTPYGALISHRAAVLHVLWTTSMLTAAMLSMPADVTVQGIRTLLLMTGSLVILTLLVDRVTRRLRYDATHDVLTGLANRAGFTRRTHAALARRAAGGGTLVVFVIDLDRFKNVNDTLGHHTGDAVLQEIAPRLVACLRPEDMVARLGGDEFAVLCEDRSGTLDVAQVAARISGIWTEPVRLAQGTMYVTGSIGAALATTSADSCASLLRDADAAMYRAKASGPGAWALHTPGSDAGSPEDLHLERELREAFDRDELFLAYQPVIDLPVGSCTRAEALLRWDSRSFGSVPPSRFVPLAEETGLIAAMGAWVLDRAARDLSRWRTTGAVGDDFQVAVNVSPRQLTPELPALVATTLARHGLPPSALALEVTESALLAPASVRPILDELNALGVRLILDDFGTGYASLSHLQRFRFDELKVDRSFVAEMCDKPCTEALVRAILSMADALGLSVVAEGIETVEQQAALQAAGCISGQGFLFARPVPAEELLVEVDRMNRSSGAARTGRSHQRQAVLGQRPG